MIHSWRKATFLKKRPFGLTILRNVQNSSCQDHSFYWLDNLTILVSSRLHSDAGWWWPNGHKTMNRDEGCTNLVTFTLLTTNITLKMVIYHESWNINICVKDRLQLYFGQIELKGLFPDFSIIFSMTSICRYPR